MRKEIVTDTLITIYGGLRHLNEPILCMFESNHFIEIIYGCPYTIAAMEDFG